MLKVEVGRRPATPRQKDRRVKDWRVKMRNSEGGVRNERLIVTNIFINKHTENRIDNAEGGRWKRLEAI
jgi:hypothetical protein